MATLEVSHSPETPSDTFCQEKSKLLSAFDLSSLEERRIDKEEDQHGSMLKAHCILCGDQPLLVCLSRSVIRHRGGLRHWPHAIALPAIALGCNQSISLLQPIYTPCPTF